MVSVRKLNLARIIFCGLALAVSPAATADEGLIPLSLNENLDAYQKRAGVSALLEDLVSDHRFYLELSGETGTWKPTDSGYRLLARRLDLDADGVDEVLAEIRSSGSCGSGGCTTHILRRADGAPWKVIGSLFGSEVLISSRRTRGHSDLVVRGKSGEVYCHKWNGEAYEEAD